MVSPLHKSDSETGATAIGGQTMTSEANAAPEKETAADQAADNRPNADGADNDGATAVLDDLETLRARAQERDQFLNLLQRTQADFENYQKRNQREREQERRYWHGALALDLLPVIDNLDRAMTAAKQANESGPLVQG